MAVSAIELKPRGALALFDSAVRLCARTSGAWALALPGGAVVTWAALQLADAIHGRRDVLVPALLFTLAWLGRGIFMGATCHYLDELVIGATPPTTWRSLRAAFARAPSLIVTAAYLPFFNAISIGCTVGLAYFFLSSHLVGYAVTMKGKGNPLALYGTCARMLGPAKSHAPAVRWLFAVILLVGVNLHIAANGLIFLGRKLGGIDLTYAQRFTSLDNSVWVTVVCALSFALFEPLRAAVGTLLLIDGRVRQEGLDLVAAVEQLPTRKPAKKVASGAGAAAGLLLCVLGALAPSAAQAKRSHRSTAPQRAAAASTAKHSIHAPAAKPAPPEDDDSSDLASDRSNDDSAVDDQTGTWDDPDEVSGDSAAADDEAGGLGLASDDEDAEDDAPQAPTGGVVGGVIDTSKQPAVDRLVAAAEACRYSGQIRAELQGADRLGPAEQKALGRLADDVELYTWTWRDCGTALARLQAAMPLVQQSIAATDASNTATASAKAKEILARPEFAPIPERVKKPDTPEEDDPNSLLNRFNRWLRDFLKKLFDSTPDHPEVTPPPTLGAGSGIAASSFIALLLVLAVVVLVAVILFLAFRGKGQAQTEYELETAAVGKDAPDPMSALSRPPEGWAHLADELAAQGDFREAVRSLYLALLSRLHRIGAIDYDPTLSNWDYARQFRGHREWVPAFKDLTLRFDFAWYGHVEVNREGYAQFRTLTEPILAAPVDGQPAVAWNTAAPAQRTGGSRPNA